jgi:hypothetical protein
VTGVLGATVGLSEHLAACPCYGSAFPHSLPKSCPVAALIPVQVGVELQPSHPHHFSYLQLPVYDMPEQDIVAFFPAAFKFIDAGMNAGAHPSRMLHPMAAWVQRSFLAHAHCAAEADCQGLLRAQSCVYLTCGSNKQLLLCCHISRSATLLCLLACLCVHLRRRWGPGPLPGGHQPQRHHRHCLLHAQGAAVFRGSHGSSLSSAQQDMAQHGLQVPARAV